MTADLEALVVAAYVFTDEYPVPPRPGRPAQVSDAELVALAVCQAVMGIPSERQFLGLVERILPGWFPHLPCQSQYNRRLRSLVELISAVQRRSTPPTGIWFRTRRSTCAGSSTTMTAALTTERWGENSPWLADSYAQPKGQPKGARH